MGDQQAFDELVTSHQDYVARLAYRLLGWHSEVPDVVQDVFLSVLQNLNRFRSEASFSTWLTRIAINKCRSYQRRKLLRMQTYRRFAERLRQSDSRSEQEPREYEEVREAVRKLPMKYREPIVLRYFENLSVLEISEVLCISPGAVDVRLSRARRQLRSRLAGYFAGEE